LKSGRLASADQSAAVGFFVTNCWAAAIEPIETANAIAVAEISNFFGVIMRENLTRKCRVE
jgi:hypothetical protein